MTQQHRAQLPRLLVVVRHGQYDGNLGPYPTRESQTSGLNDLGRSQADAVRDWLDEANISPSLEQRLVSPLRRAQETAMRIFPNGWTVSEDLRERSRGAASHLSKEDGQKLFPEWEHASRAQPIQAKPPEGESLQVDVALRIRRLLSTLDSRPTIWATHAEYMWSVRFLLAGFSEHAMRRSQRAPKPRFQDISNGRIDIYSATAPDGSLTPGFSWFRSVVPQTDDPRYDTGWCVIDHPLPDPSFTRGIDGHVFKATGPEALDNSNALNSFVDLV